MSRSIESFHPAVRRCSAALILALALATAAACNSKNPVAPDTPQPPGGGGPGTGSYAISLSASPVQLVAGSADPATLTVIATRTDNSQPAADGTTAAVSTSLGSFDPAKSTTLTTVTLSGGKGMGTVLLYPSTTTGTATVLAQVDTSSRQLSIPIRQADQTFFIASVSPGSGRPDGGTTVSLTGAGFVQTMRVTFGGIASTSVTYVSATQLTVKTPPPPSVVTAGNALAVDVTISKSNGTANVTDTLPGGFIYANNGNGETPVIISVTPSWAPTTAARR